MSLFTSALFWAPLLFGFVVAASYVGTMLALRSYHEDEQPSIRDAFGVDDGRE